MLNIILLALVTLTSASSDTAVCDTDGTEYRISDVVFGCSAAWGASEIELINGQEVYVMLIPEHVVDLNLTLSAGIDVDIIIKDATDMTVPGALLPCIVGPSCEISSQGEYSWPSDSGTMTIIYTGDDQADPVYEHVFIPHTDRPLAYTVKAHATGSALAYYDYAGVEPCSGESGECAQCSDYTGCKAPYTASCDGTTSVSCVIPTEMPTVTPTMSEFEVLYRECSQELADTEFEKDQHETLLGLCAERGISCTVAPSNTPTTAPSNDPSVTPTDAPTDVPTVSPTDNPSISDPTASPTENPSNQPTWSPTCDCYDLIPAGQDFWYDSLGVKYTCSWYASDPTRYCEDDHENFGLTAAEACCICRGGSCSTPTGEPSVDPTMQPSDNPSLVPTDAPSVDPTEEPTDNPTIRPTTTPSDAPSDNPTVRSTSQSPSDMPSDMPTEDPTKTPSSYPTEQPSNEPTETPSKVPSNFPSKNPSTHPTPAPTSAPSTPEPSSNPTERPTEVPTGGPSVSPTDDPTRTPSTPPTFQPTNQPTGKPIGTPSKTPSAAPTIACKDLIPPGTDKWVDGYGLGYGCEWYALDARFCTYDDEHYQNFGLVAKDACCVCGGGSSFVPTSLPSVQPSAPPSMAPLQPSSDPTDQPTDMPSMDPTDGPSRTPSEVPSLNPSGSPSYAPTPECYDFLVDGVDVWYDLGGPKYTCAWYEGDPERFCEQHGDDNANFGKTATQACAVCGRCLHDPLGHNPPTNPPSDLPTGSPSGTPSFMPTGTPSMNPSQTPTESPTTSPTDGPTNQPTDVPTMDPTEGPTSAPSSSPSNEPTDEPTRFPSEMPSDMPSMDPTDMPSDVPTQDPTPQTPMPTDTPTVDPTMDPTVDPSNMPSSHPTHVPTPAPSDAPTDMPSNDPTRTPSDVPTLVPSNRPTVTPVCDPCYDLVPEGSDGVWYDSFGEQYTCEFYESDPWRFCAYDSVSYQRFGLVAAQACCVCGGGSCSVPTFAPTDAPSDVPTFAPTNEPTNNPSRTPSDAPTTDEPTDAPTMSPTELPTHMPSPQPTLMPTDVPSLQPTENPGTQEPTFAPTQLPTQSCEALLAQALEDCDTSSCEDSDSSSTSDCTKAYDDEIALGAVSVALMSEVDSYTLSKMEEAGVPAGIGLMQYNGEFYILNTKDGSYTPTCVQYSANSGTACDEDKVCSGSGGSTVGWGGNMGTSLLEALNRLDLQHPQCPSGCNDLSDWWVNYFQSQGLSAAANLCTVGDAMYMMDSDGVKHNTCVGFGSAEDMCPTGDLICSGLSDAGEVTFGWQSSIANTLSAALNSADGMHPQCPDNCSCCN